MREDRALPQRFAGQGGRVHDNWHGKPLALVDVPSTPVNLERIHGIFAFHSNLLQNIVAFTPGNFLIRVLTQPLAPDGPETFSRLPPAAAAVALRRALAFLEAAREWRLDFVDFSRFQLLPCGAPCFAWSLEPLDLPSPAALRSLLCRQGTRPGGEAALPPEDGEDHLCRREDLASHRLLARAPRGLGSGANAVIRIHTRFPWQEEVARDSLYHNLNDAETLLLHFDLEDEPLGRQVAALCRARDAEDPAVLTREFRLFLKKSVFREAVLLVRGQARREDAHLLRFLLDAEDLSGLTVVLFDGSVACESDLEFNEDPQNALAGRLARACGDARSAGLGAGERDLLESIAAIGVPVPEAEVRLLISQGEGRSRPAIPGGEDPLSSLLRRGLLQASRGHRGLEASLPGGSAPLPPRKGEEALARIAERGDWPYARISRLIADERPGTLEEYLRGLAGEYPGKIVPGPAADLLCRRLAQAAPGDAALAHGIEVLIQGGCLEQAARLLDGIKAPDPPWARLKKAHLALRRREYRELGRLLAGLGCPADGGRDEWMYLNFMHCEKLSRRAKADDYAGKIRSPYYRGLSLIQLSDRAIYNREFAKARAQLAGALDYFSAGRGVREEIAARSQLAKLLREEGNFTEAESLYKAIYIRGEEEELVLSAAAAAVDLGNLYVEADDDFPAECWYRKAGRLYARAGNADGRMLVNANLVNVLLAKGDWLQADRLLREVLAWDEEKKLLSSSAIDLLNRAGLETLRLRDDKALQLIASAEAIFRTAGNRKGLGECAFMRVRVSGDPRALPEARPGEACLNADQRAVCALLRLPEPARGGAREEALRRRLRAVASKKLRFEALRLLLRKHRRGDWLDLFRELAWELSPQVKNYFFYEYWHMFFELAPYNEPVAPRDEFLAMHDFFVRNQRAVSAKLARMRRHCEESEKGVRLFADARLVEQRRQWRLPGDFFHSFFRELAQAAPIDWLAMAVHEKGRELFRFASNDSFRDLGDEMLRRALAEPAGQDHDLAEVRRLYRSPERLFYPFAATQLIRWAIAEDLLACLAVGSRDGALRFQDLGERCRETFRTFALLFGDFLQNEYRISEKLDFIVGASEKVREMKRMIAQVAKVDFSLLIGGESGSGKELVARAVHLLSPRAQRPFVSVNAAAIPDTLLEAELFGYRKGAFSGASENRVGLLEAADRGTLFLDEIGDLPLPLQAKLLRALQEREIRRLGENQTVRIDVRLISASNRDLEELVRDKLFRADLLYRLQDLVIRIPPLRERREDIPLLVGHFLGKYGHPMRDPARLEAIAAGFATADFPGNVRELESKVKNLITFNPGLDFPPVGERPPFSWKNARAGFEKELLLRVLQEQSGRRSRTAERLGISRMALFNLLKKHGIDV